MCFNNKEEAKLFLVENSADLKTIDYEVSFEDIDIDAMSEDDVIPFLQLTACKGFIISDKVQ